MIVGRLKDFRPEDFASKNLRTAFEFIRTHDLLALPAGKTVIDSDNVWVNRSSYVGKEERDTKWENHHLYLDIQLVIRGKEEIDYCDISNPSVKPTGEFDTVKDKGNYTADAEAKIVLNDEAFVIVYPSDLHRPCIKVDDNTIEKAVFKVKID